MLNEAGGDDSTIAPLVRAVVAQSTAGLQDVVLEGRWVRLEPLMLDHHGALSAIGCDPDLWRFTASDVRTPSDMLRYMEGALASRSGGTALPFVTIDRASAAIVGSTRFRNYDVLNRHLEIGFTWLAKPWQRTAINTEAKYLMLGHAFEALRCVRVELRTHVMNARSRAAILRLGAREEGVLRKDTLMWTGEFRDTVYFSILDDEWPGVKRRLESLLSPYRVRRATSADAARVERCLREAFEPYRGEYTPAAFADTVPSLRDVEARIATMTCLIACDDAGEVLGTITAGALEWAEW